MNYHSNHSRPFVVIGSFIIFFLLTAQAWVRTPTNKMQKDDIMRGGFVIAVVDTFTRQAEAFPAGSVETEVRMRSNAEGEKTLWFKGKGSIASWDITIPSEGAYTLALRFSNDNLQDDSGELVSVSVNGESVGSIILQDTGPWGDNCPRSNNSCVPGEGGGGRDWDCFGCSGPAVPLGTLTAGNIRVTLEVLQSDGFGVEIDYLDIIGPN